MNLQSLNKIYFLGIGGIGMSALARYFRHQGVAVYGYDRVRTPLCEELETAGTEIHYDDNVEKIPSGIDLCVYTPAIPKENEEFVFFKNSDIPFRKRSEILGELTKNGKAIGVAGTHGKTTISTLIAHLFDQSIVGCNAFLGGISKNFDSNLVLSKNSPWVVIEADEFDRSFLTLYPEIAVVSSTDADHLDIYNNHQSLIESFEAYLQQVKPQGCCFIKYGLHLKSSTPQQTYALTDHRADFYASNIHVENGSYFFDLHTPESIFKNIEMQYPGLHNIENAIVSLAIAIKCGISESEWRAGLRGFSGVKRRFDIQVRRPDFIYMDDYAHHPREITACITSLRDLYPNKKITGIFQPHLYTRTRDFADGFAESLSLLDSVILLDIYPARELPIEGVSSQMLLDKIIIADKKLCTKANLLDVLSQIKTDVLLTIGAGDIDQLVQPIKFFFTK